MNSSILMVTEPGGTFPVGTIVQSLQLPAAGGTTGLMRLPPFAQRLMVCPATLVQGALIAFYTDLVTIAITSGNGPGSAPITVKRGSDLRLIEGVWLVGSGQFARIDNQNAVGAITITAWVELAG